MDAVAPRRSQRSGQPDIRHRAHSLGSTGRRNAVWQMTVKARADDRRLLGVAAVAVEARPEGEPERRQPRATVGHPSGWDAAVEQLSRALDAQAAASSALSTGEHLGGSSTRVSFASTAQRRRDSDELSALCLASLCLSGILAQQPVGVSFVPCCHGLRG